MLLALLLSCLAAQQSKPEPLPQGAVVRMGSTGKSTGHMGLTESVSFSVDGKTLASAGDAVRLWDMATSQERLVLPYEQNNPARSVAISPDGKLLASSEMNKGVLIRELPSGKEVRTLTPKTDADAFGSIYVTQLAFSRDGRTLLSVNLDRKVILWDVASGKAVTELSHHGVRSVGWSADGKILVSGGYQDKSVRVWDVPSGRELFQLDGEGEVALSPDGRRLAYAGTNRGKGYLWEIDPHKEPQPIAWSGKYMGSLAFSPDGKTLAISGDGKIALIDAVEAKSISEYKADTYRVLSFSPDGKTLAYGMYMGVGLISLHDGKRSELSVVQPGRHQSQVSSLAFSPDGTTLASAAHDATVRLWDASTGRERHLLRGHSYWMNRLVYSKDGSILASAGQDDTVRLWDAQTGKETLKIKCGDQWPQRIVLSENGTITITGEYGNVARWDSTGKQLLKRKGSGHPSQAALSPDGTLMAVAESSFGDRKASFKILEVETGKLRASIPPAGAHFFAPAMAFSPDGKLLAWGCGDELNLSDATTGEAKLKMESVHAHWPTNGAMAFSSDGTLLATAGDDSTIIVHETASGKQVARLTGHKGPVSALAFSPDGRRLASGSADTTILIWDAAGWKK